MGPSRIEQTSTPQQPGVTVWRIVLTRQDAVRWDRERLEMFEDAIWLMRQAFAGYTEGPLTLPKTRLPIRSGANREQAS